jgi:ABC-2 type transport system ATP-binding protein
VQYKAPKELIMTPNDFEIISTSKTNGTYSSRIKLGQHKSSNELLQLIIAQAEVVGYQEVLPTINDIFIKEVNKSKNE